VTPLATPPPVDTEPVTVPARRNAKLMFVASGATIAVVSNDSASPKYVVA